MSESNTQLATTDSTDDDNAPVTQEDDWSEAPVIDNTGNAKVRDFDAASDDHPLVQYAGDKALKTDISGGGEFVSEEIYQSDEAWPREWLQNHETACIRRCKMVVSLSDEYPDGWLTQTLFVDSETGETVEDRDDVDDNTIAMEIPRPIDEVMEAARSLGYDPTIVWDVYLDEREVHTEDNGIGMTAREFWEAFKSPFSSGSGVDGETGGNFGIGSNSVEKAHGEDGAAKVYTRTPRPGDRPGYEAYSYRGGATAIGEPIPDGEFGTRFEIPIREGFDLSKLQSWVEEYADKLRVPILYREHDAGSTPVEEEYESTNFVDDYGDPPVVVERPGEFSVVAGPDVIDTGYHADDEDTFLVSMPIDRNTRASISTFWNVVIQIHDEQGRIVMGPNRGHYSDGSYVYDTGQNEQKLGKLHEDDIVLPQPTGDRDRLKKTDKAKEFFYYIQDVVESKELEEVSDIAQRMKDADHPADAIRGNKSDWTLFKKMVNYHGSHRVTEKSRKFKKFINDRDEFPDYNDETLKQMYGLLKEIQHCHNGAGRSAKKSRRSAKPLGDILAANDSDEVYMAASTGGNFTQRFRVIENTHDDPEVIVIGGASKYDRWANLFGFKVLKEVPLTDTDEDDHDYDVPDSVHESKINKGSSNRGKPDKVLDRALKIRTDDDNSSIDLRLSIEDAKKRLEDDGRFGGHKKLVLFTSERDTENISDHYDFSKYAAIASVSKKEYEALADYDNVMTYAEFIEWSESALIATEDGAMTPGALVADDRMVVLAFRPTPHEKEVVKLLGDDYEQLRNYYVEDIRDQCSWAAELDGYDGGYRGDDVGEVPDDDKKDTLFAVADSVVLNRAERAFDDLRSEQGYDEFDLVGLKLTRQKFGYHNPAVWWSLDKTTTRYRLMADTPNWDDSSDIYGRISNRESCKAQMYLGFHDRGIDPSEKSADELRDLIGGKN
jgi:hypothetical protein